LIITALAFVPGLAGTFSVMPDPVMGALLIYSTCFLLLAGLQLMTARMLDARRIFGVGIALVFGLSVEVAPELYRNVPESVRPIFASSTALATLIAVALNLLFRIGLAKESTLEVRQGEDNLDEISRFMDEQGAAWGMRQEVVTRATDAIYEFVTNAGILDLRSPAMKVVAHFNELRLDVEIEYEGPPILLTQTLPTVEELASGSGVADLSRYLIQQSADQVRVKKTNENCILCLHFEH
jgi:NCS2 family nucleobase:cation symporter-2